MSLWDSENSKLLRMSELPAIKDKELVEFLKFIGFRVTRAKGSHVRLRREDGKVTTVPVHGETKRYPKGFCVK